MKIEILGTGCAKCRRLAETARAAADKLGLQYELVKITDLRAIASYGVMLTPALAINGQVKLTGKVPSETELTTLLMSELAR